MDKRAVLIPLLLCSAVTAQQSNEDQPFKWITKPGKGVQMAKIDSVYHHGYSKLIGMGSKFQEDTVLLLNDGWSYHGLQVSPADLDVAASRKNEPEEWFKWKRQGQNVLEQDPESGKWEEIAGFKVLPADPNERIQITLEASSSVSFGLAGSFSSFHTLTLNKGGTFERSGRSIGGSGSTQADGGVSVGSTSTSGKDGCSSGTSVSGSGVAGGSSSQSDCGKANRGRYKLDGYTAEFQDASGKTERVLFYFWDEDKTNLFFGDTTFSKEK
ncbi:hypothetical protein [Deinococcus sp.]|uniref:hypothetical protein n=1 Tax=Deinococcus sp. TaxID=47478 RepID=UPI003B5BF1AD